MTWRCTASIDRPWIHGQVVVGWGQPLDVSFIVLVDDEVSGSDWERISTGWCAAADRSDIRVRREGRGHAA